jgi:hypothetical protein
VDGGGGGGGYRLIVKVLQACFLQDLQQLYAGFLKSPGRPDKLIKLSGIYLHKSCWLFLSYDPPLCCPVAQGDLAGMLTGLSKRQKKPRLSRALVDERASEESVASREGRNGE